MSATPVTQPTFATPLPDVAAVAVGHIVARMLGWNTTDLVWSLWLSSLTLGYLSILLVIGKGFYIGSAVVFSDGFPEQYRTKAIMGGSLVGLFVLAFFSLHFCGFHAVHAGLLSSFFPPVGVPKQVFSSVSFNPIRLLGSAFNYLMPKYGFFLVPIIISERRLLFGSVGAESIPRAAVQGLGGVDPRCVRPPLHQCSTHARVDLLLRHLPRDEDRLLRRLRCGLRGVFLPVVHLQEAGRKSASEPRHGMRDVGRFKPSDFLVRQLHAQR